MGDRWQRLKGAVIEFVEVNELRLPDPRYAPDFNEFGGFKELPRLIQTSPTRKMHNSICLLVEAQDLKVNLTGIFPQFRRTIKDSLPGRVIIDVVDDQNKRHEELSQF